jgi:glycosyltransferase involved in cell wall biosynthesis
MNKKILVICPFPQQKAAGQRLKYEQYLDDWRAEGHQVDVSSFMDLPMWDIVYTKGNLLKKIAGTIRGTVRTWRAVLRIPRYDIVYIFMYVSPVGTSFFERMARILAKKTLYDIEDNVMLQQSNELNPITRILRAKSKFDYLIKNADHVISSSPSLNDFCKEKNRFAKATYISASMDTERFIPVNKYTNGEKIVIGWTGTFSSRIYLDLLRPVFTELKKKRDFSLLVIGNFDYSFAEMDLEVIKWTAETEVEDLQKMDIGVYPLPNDEWVSGKSGLKAIQYMSIGIPAVATKAGTTPTIIDHMVDGCLVETQEDWVNMLVALIDDPTLRKRIGVQARITAENRFSKHAIKSEYLSIINNL